jgi:uncharacterized linocin/CFP29 family protein
MQQSFHFPTGASNNRLRVPPVAGVIWGENTFNAVVQGISELNMASQPGPFALILPYRVYADTHLAIGFSFTTADRITPLVIGGFCGTAALPVFTGLLVSLGGEPTTLYVGAEATAAFSRKDDEELHFFRVFERVQFSAIDARAFVSLDFTPPAPPAN